MSYIRWTILFGTVAGLAACTPFLGPRTPDGGDAVGAAGSGGGAMSGSTDEDAAVSTPDVGAAASTDSQTHVLNTSGSPNGASCSLDTDCRFGHCIDGVCCENACTGKCMSC